MEIQSASAYAPYSYLNIYSHQKQAPANTSANYSTCVANNTDTVAISQTARNYLSTQSNSAAASGNSATSVFDTDQGSLSLNIDDYFSADLSTNGTTSLLQSLPPLLLPTQDNIKALASHISEAFPQFLAQNNIPSAPSSITYDNKGQIQLPSDYAYASELEQALANNPTMARELKTVHALSSHLAGIEEGSQFRQEYAAAASQAEAKAVVAKYGYLFDDNRQYSTIALHFAEEGYLTITADNENLF